MNRTIISLTALLLGCGLRAAAAEPAANFEAGWTGNDDEIMPDAPKHSGEIDPTRVAMHKAHSEHRVASPKHNGKNLELPKAQHKPVHHPRFVHKPHAQLPPKLKDDIVLTRDVTPVHKSQLEQLGFGLVGEAFTDPSGRKEQIMEARAARRSESHHNEMPAGKAVKDQMHKKHKNHKKKKSFLDSAKDAVKEVAAKVSSFTGASAIIPSWEAGGDKNVDAEGPMGQMGYFFLPLPCLCCVFFYYGWRRAKKSGSSPGSPKSMSPRAHLMTV